LEFSVILQLNKKRKFLILSSTHVLYCKSVLHRTLKAQCCGCHLSALGPRPRTTNIACRFI